MRENFPANLSTLINTLQSIDSHGQASLIASSDVHTRMLKKSRSDGSLPPAWSVGLVCITRSIVNVNHNYQNAINNHLAKTGMAPVFQAEESKISKPVDGWPNTLLREGLKNPDQLYVRVFIEMGSMSKILDTVYLNGKNENVTDLVTPQFKADFLPIPSGSVKQAEHGVSKEVQPREYKAENIMYIQKGKTVFNKLSKDIMDIFNLEVA